MYLITGMNGMLAHAFRESEYFKDHKGVDEFEGDITDLEILESVFEKYKPSIVINCAAYTDVTGAEKSTEMAYKINGEGVRNLALMCKKYNCKLIHFSTDFIFPGNLNKFYVEDDTPDPVNLYGASKLAGENYVREILEDYLIIRISWLFGPNGKNFVSTISKFLEEKEFVKIVSDQFGKTTYTFDVVKATENLLENKAQGIFHFTNTGTCSRYEFTVKIKEILAKTKPINCEVLPILGKDYPDPTPRPTWSFLNTDKYEKVTGKKITSWQESLEEYMLI